ncbi:pancreatic lipase-related protein 2 [Pectinophora gossypiella]|uniref:pancreatic lipase-related protein 2 n=1 Tax=Pectinophora gossypiella TaxID=13191 RepID=UPI00214EE048|nr:pancreatic lipase-related protein 2 [Pectinophora gossypiella]
MYPRRASCRLMTFFIGVSEICFMTGPVGDCRYCCPRDDTVDIQYKLFTRSNPRDFQIIQGGDAAGLRGTNFDPRLPTIIYLPGFTEVSTGPSTTTLRNSYLATGDYNFIAVDWSRLVAFPWYVTAVRNTRYMGSRLATFVQFLNAVGVRPGSLHVIGFSLGAEAAGFAGKELKSRGLMLGRITGLDPAYPGYSFTNSQGHLSRGDASFVDVIHTNPGIFGFPLPIGDVDFYPNAGSWIQPGCWINQLVTNNELDFVNGCSHNRAWRLYAESLYNPAGFPATLCRDWTSWVSSCRFHVDGYLGVQARLPMTGKMYLKTNERPPFAKNGP